MSEFDNNTNVNNENTQGNTDFSQNEDVQHDANSVLKSGETNNHDFAHENEETQTVHADKVFEPQNGAYNYGYSHNNAGSFYQNNQNSSYPPYGNGQQFSNPSQFSGGVKPKKKNRGIVVLCIVLAVVFLATGTVFGVKILSSRVQGDNGNGSYLKESGDTDTEVANGGNVVIEAKKESGALTTTEIASIAKKSSVGVVVYSTKTNTINFGAQSGDNSNKTGEGSGVIIKLDNQGEYTYIVTCAHVISDANISVKILLEDGTTYDAEIVGYDGQTDVGLLRVKNKSLQKNAATIGTSENLQVGQSVFAIGNPGGSEFFGSFTSGVVSAIGRSLSSSTGYTMECIQHDAAINPGNSGGGLLNAQGQLIGINSSKIASTEYEGMSFAVPIDEVISVVNSLSSYGYVPNRPKLGITYALARNYSQAYNMIVSLKGLPSGSLIIASISNESSLKNLGVEKGDIIVSANGKKLDTADVLLDIIEKGKVGDTIELGICRIQSNYEVKEFTVKATLVEDKGSKASNDEEQTTQSYEDYFNYFFGNGN